MRIEAITLISRIVANTLVRMARTQLDKQLNVRLSHEHGELLDKLVEASPHHTTAAYLRPLLEELVTGNSLLVKLEHPYSTQLRSISEQSEIPVEKLVRRAIIDYLDSVIKSGSLKLNIQIKAAAAGEGNE